MVQLFVIAEAVFISLQRIQHFEEKLLIKPVVLLSKQVHRGFSSCGNRFTSGPFVLSLHLEENCM